MKPNTDMHSKDMVINKLEKFVDMVSILSESTKTISQDPLIDHYMDLLQQEATDIKNTIFPKE